MPDDLRQVGQSLIGAAQLCDGPVLPAEELPDESAYHRMIQGEGEFPLLDFVAGLPPDIITGIEVPMNRRRDEGMGPRERADRHARRYMCPENSRPPAPDAITSSKSRLTDMRNRLQAEDQIAIALQASIGRLTRRLRPDKAAGARSRRVRR